MSDQTTIKWNHQSLATAPLLLTALDLAYRHDLRPEWGPLARQTTHDARAVVACELVNWALGNPPAEEPPLEEDS